MPRQLGSNSQFKVLLVVSILVLLTAISISNAETSTDTFSTPTSTTTSTPPVANPVLDSDYNWWDFSQDKTPKIDASGYRFGPALVEEERTAPSEEDLIHFKMNDWNEMRRAVESGRKPGEATVDAVEKSTFTAEAPKPPSGQIKVDLPYESSLAVTGRKVIKVELKNTHISKERADELGTKQDSQSFDMEQELQARIQGTVARKTTINVNFDDTKENVRDFSVIYKGDPDEVVQEAAFGDITLSLPSTEFVNYNKQLFGIRASLKYKRLGFMAIGSRTKGTTETKRFVGSTTRNQVYVNDTAYIRRKFYDLTFSTSVNAGGMNVNGINAATVQPIQDVREIVLIEDNSVTGPQLYRIATPTAPAAMPLEIRMREMSPGVDYVMDRNPNKGPATITFINQIPVSSRVAIVFTMKNGFRLDGVSPNRHPNINSLAQAVLIKDGSIETPQVSQEIKRYYSVNARNIVRDNNGLGNFVFKVMDKNREKVIGEDTSILDPLQRYPDNIEMNFNTGIFTLDRELSSPPAVVPDPFDDVYANNVSEGSAIRAVFSVEFQAILRTFNLRPNIVLQSESVVIDGRKVNRDLDYFIDYDIGLITFFNDDLIRESTTIEVTYEFAPFGGTLGETLVGARGTYDILSNKRLAGVNMESWTAGSTVLYNFAAKPTAPPDIRSTPASLMVTEADTNMKGVQFGKLPLKTNFSAEGARSSQDPNLFGKALIDSFEGLKQEDSSPMLKDSWLVSANPVEGSYNVVSKFSGRENTGPGTPSHLRWEDTDVLTLDPNDENATQKALVVSYDLEDTNEQVSLVNVVSLAGRDFSKKSNLEIEVQGAGPINGQDVDLIVDYGTFNEDSDEDNILDTEDLNPLDGVLNLGEDIGWQFDGPLGTIRVGGNNTRMDTEDFNNDKSLNSSDLPVLEGGGPLFTLSDLSFSDRQVFRVPLNIQSRPVNIQNNFAAVRQVRITIRSRAATRVTGAITISKISMVGTNWDPPELTNLSSTMTVRAVNNKDDAQAPTFYVPLVGNPDYSALYKDAVPTGDDFREQALAINYTLEPQSTGTTVDKFGAVRDFSKHDSLRFFLFRRNDGNEDGYFFFQAGSETDFQEAAIDIADIPDGVWTMIDLKQADVNSDGIPDTWQSSNPNVRVRRQGAIPNLSQIAQLKVGIVNDTAATIANEIWLNEIHVSGSHQRIGNAKKYAFDSTWENWMDFGGSFRNVDRHWQTPTTPITNQDSEQETAFFNFNRLSVLPMTFKTSRDTTVTPSAFQSNSNSLVSVLDEGRVENKHHAGTASLLIPKLPQFSFNYNQDISENTITQRTEKTDAFRAGTTYSPTLKNDILPGGFLTFRPIPTAITLNYGRTLTKVDYSELESLSQAGVSTTPFASTDITQVSEENEARLAFSFWDGFNINPTYKLKIDKDRRDFREDELTNPTLNPSQSAGLNGLENKLVPRAIAQTVSASGNLRLLKWLDPRFNYTYSGTETNNTTTLTDTTGYLLKSIDRTSSGELSATIQAAQVVPSTKLFSSLNINTSYKVENGDSYKNVPGDFGWKSKLWVGTPLNISSSTSDLASRSNLTDKRTFRTNTSWLPFVGYRIEAGRAKPLSTLSLTNNYLLTTEDSETTGTTKRIKSVTLPDVIVTINDTEDFFNIKKVIDESRLVVKANVKKDDTVNIDKKKTESYGTDYQFKLMKKWDVATSYNISKARQSSLISSLLSSESDTKNYSVQTRIPNGNWAYTPRYQRSESNARDSVNITNDLRSDTISVQIYGDINRPLGIRFGRFELGVANRLIMNSTLQWEKRRSNVNPSTNFLDLYTGTISGDYTLSRNFRMALSGNFNQEVHHPDFSKLDQTSFGIGTTLTIQF